MGRKTATTVLVAVALATTSACSGSSCAKVRGAGEIKVQVPAAIRELVDDVRVELCQGARCKDVTFASRTQEAGGAVAPGISLSGASYLIALEQLGDGWKPRTKSRLTVLGTATSGRVVLRHQEQFAFDAYVPTKDDCDQTPTLTHVTGVSGADLAD